MCVFTTIITIDRVSHNDESAVVMYECALLLGRLLIVYTGYSTDFNPRNVVRYATLKKKTKLLTLQFVSRSLACRLWVIVMRPSKQMTRYYGSMVDRCMYDDGTE